MQQIFPGSAADEPDLKSWTSNLTTRSFLCNCITSQGSSLSKLRSSNFLSFCSSSRTTGCFGLTSSLEHPPFAMGVAECFFFFAVEPPDLPAPALSTPQRCVKGPLKDGYWITTGSRSSCIGCSNFLPSQCIQEMAWGICVAFLGSAGFTRGPIQY